MPKKLLDTDEFEPIEGDYEDISTIQGDLDQQLAEIVSEFGGADDDTEYSVRVYRAQQGKGGKLGYLFTCSYTELPILDRLRDDYGGGTFEVRVLVNGKIYTRRKCLVEPPLKRELSAPPPQEPIINAMVTGFSQLGELIVQNQQKSDSMKDMLENMVLMKQIMGEQPPAPNPLEQLKGLLEIQQMIGGNEGGTETNVNDVLVSLAETVLPKLAENTEGKIEKNPVKEITKEKINPMKMQLVYLCQQAKNNKNPSLYAELVLDNVSDEKLDELVEFMTSDDAIEKMVIIHKPVENYREWFKKLGEEILKLVVVDEESEQELDLTGDENTAINQNDALESNAKRDIIHDPERESGYKSGDENDETPDSAGEKIA